MRKLLSQLCLWFALCLVGLLPAANVTAQPAHIIAVFDIESRDVPIGAAAMVDLNDYMFVRLAAAGFKLTPQSQVRDRVVQLKAESHQDCFDQSCQIDLAKAVAAQKALASKLRKYGDSCSLQSVIYDLRTETTDDGAEAQGPCTVAGIKASIDRVVAIFKGEVVTSTGPVSGGRVETSQVIDRGADIVNVPTDETAFFVIHSNPSGATVSINGKEIGQTPQHLEYPLGKYIVVAELGRLYHPARQEVLLNKRGGKATVTLDLKPAFGSAIITSSPSKAQVWLDGESAGETPLVISKKLSGTYHVRLQSPDYLPSEGELVIEDGKETKYNRQLAANWGQLRVTSDPPGATVYLDDIAVKDKTTPCTLDRVKPGVHIVKFALAGHGERTEKTTVERGQTSSVSTPLPPMLGYLVVTSTYTDGTVCEGDIKLDGKSVGQTPWGGDVLAVPHTVEVQCPNGKGRQQVVVVHNKRSEANVAIDTAGIEWVRIPGGSFNMGSNDGDIDEKPVHRVTVPTFEMSKTAVTFKQYRACVSAGGCKPAHVNDGTCRVWNGSEWVDGTLPSSFQGDDQPVVCVNWDQAQAFARWAGGRLPSEAEWEYAARSGGRDWKYPWGNENATCERAVMDDGSGDGCGRASTWPVCSKPSGNTTHGLCDMAGNVSEWVQDWFHGYGGAPTDGSAWESPAHSYRVLRGGSWRGYAGYVRAADRGCHWPGARDREWGFRVARSVR
ncbi:MAG: Serine/threonine-protein kinase pkn1 [Deltaproteobacteria bacterium ADurb.Bin058]|nr:MAG: Serine/threonine-protein kinase pkn1 [Deltaproteobacteria bacterium ADurb.Bin058]